jgi:uncharacterized protein (DUF58 family)
MAAPRSFFDSELLARLAKLELTARRVVDGFLSGHNRSTRHGFSVEFVEHREYGPGDDLRHLDWKVLGRQDRLMVKRYEEETNINVLLLLDVSASMGYLPPASAGSGRTKFETAAYTAAALSHLLARQRDAVGLCLFDEGVRVMLPPSARRIAVAHIASQLAGAETRRKTDLEEVVRRAAGEVGRRSLFVILSDLFVPPESARAALKFLHARGHDAIVLHTLDPAELTFPFRSNTLFRSLEDPGELLVEPRRLRTRYLEALQGFLEEVRRECRSLAYDYQLLDAGEPLAPALASLMAARARRRKIVRGRR